MAGERGGLSGDIAETPLRERHVWTMVPRGDLTTAGVGQKFIHFSLVIGRPGMSSPMFGYQDEAQLLLFHKTAVPKRGNFDFFRLKMTMKSWKKAVLCSN